MAKHAKKKNSKVRNIIITSAMATITAVTAGSITYAHNNGGINAGNDTHNVSNVSYTRSNSTDVSRSSARRDLLTESVSAGDVTGTWELGEELNIPYSQSTDEKTAVSNLRKAIDDGNKLYDSSNGKVNDDNTRKTLRAAIDDASKLVSTDSNDSVQINIDDYNNKNKAISDASGKVNESINAYNQEQAAKRAAAASSSSGGGSSLGKTVPVGEMQTWAHDYMISNGYNEEEWSAMSWIITKESGWNPNAVNSSSGARGLGQCLGHVACQSPDYINNYQTQFKWALDYVNGRYNGPLGAIAFWRTHNWY